MNFLEHDDKCQRLLGSIGDGAESFAMSAVADTGAEGNVMDYRFAKSHNMPIRKGGSRRKFLQFADGTSQETVGQVETYWTFETGERIPVTFEVLENCCSDVIIGDDILYDFNVFEDHARSIIDVDSESDIYQVAPFDIAKKWQRKCGDLFDRLTPTHKQEPRRSNDQVSHQISVSKETENKRRETWDYRYTFGDTATEAERAAEGQRRRDHDLAIQTQSLVQPALQPQLANAHQTPSSAAASDSQRRSTQAR
ncbi:MAG: hypothetical protein Q9206_006711 [Seirophora lacunosa]